MKNRYGIETNDPDTIEKLRFAGVPDRAFQGTPWYQLLSNPAYADAFVYIGAF